MANGSYMADMDLYAKLSVVPTATAAEIKKAFQKKARVLHPDKCSSDNAAKLFHEARLAFDILTHDIRRRVYDAGDYTTLEALRTSDMFDRADFLEQHPWYADAYRDSGIHDDLCHFARNVPAAQPSTPSNQLPGKADTATMAPPSAVLQMHRVHELWVSLEELYQGFSHTIHVTRLVEDQPNQVSSEDIGLTITSQPGWEDGTTIEYQGAGDLPYRGAAGAFTVVIRQHPHRIFQRRQDDLVVTARVHLWGALFGSSTKVPLISGGEHVLPVDALVPGQQERLVGHGMPRADADADNITHGDLHVLFQVAMPAHAAQAVPTRDPARPTQWTDIPLRCSRCQQMFAVSDPETTRCPGDAEADGSETFDRHEPTAQSLIDAKGRAAENALGIVLEDGDPYQIAACLLWCREAPLDFYATVAMQEHNTLGLVLLLRAGAEVPHTEGLAAALAAAATNDEHLCQHLTKILQQDDEFVDLLVRVPGVMPVMWHQICQREEPELALLLLQHPRLTSRLCKVREQTAATTKMLMACAAMNHLSCAQRLLQLSCPADGTSLLVRHTPLLKAIEHEHSDMVKLLLDYGADPDRAGYFGPLLDTVTPLGAAARCGQIATLRQLIVAGADVDFQEPQSGRTALHEACMHGQTAAVQALIASGARTSLMDADLQRPLDLALNYQHHVTTRALQSAVVQEALQSMEGLTVVRTLYDQLEYSPLVCPNMTAGEIRATVLVLSAALRVLCAYSTGLDSSCQADLCGSATGMSHALQAYERWKLSRDQPSLAADAGAAAISGLVSAGVGVKTRMQELLGDMLG
eukprot:TRINITY_DN11517_c3_g6_i1.p1 TRINITY_DN11517_c3_g6~~TRINITY_DN11517_c3_g6_i1.p1  ORF type:complete len:808 (+),score=177.54 TRINITY_DN11517_c3_g6_i1:64-2487(+)